MGDSVCVGIRCKPPVEGELVQRYATPGSRMRHPQTDMETP